MKYIQNSFRGRLNGPVHIIKGPYEAKAYAAAGLVETWCGKAFQDQVGLLPGQGHERWIHGVSSDTVSPRTRRVLPPGVWNDYTVDGGLCTACQGVLQIHTECPGELAAMGNDMLYREFREAHRPDDYDGDFTTAGNLRLELVVAEMERRLRECGFLSG